MPASDRDAVVLEALRSAAPGAVSGEELATALGVSRVAVRKRVESLRAAGYRIDAVAGTGYTLAAVPDLPLPTEVGRLLSSPLWGPLSGGGTTASTNDDCKTLARRGAGEGTVVLASEQTGGRGRLGRRWSSPPGGVYFSALLRPPLPAADVAPLSLVAGVGLARGLAALGVETSLKWPNDVLLEGRKLAGVLLEMSAEAEAVEWLVVGCGVNVKRTQKLPDTAAVLADVSQPAPGLAAVAAACLDGLADAYIDFRRGGFAALHAEYEGRACLTAADVTVSDASGAVRAAGRVAGVDESGRLIVEGPDGPHALSAGEVTLRRRL